MTCNCLKTPTHRMQEREVAAARMFGLKVDAGVCRWMGVDWLGVPFPFRLVLAVWGAWAESVAGGDPQPAFLWRLSKDYLPGCGCIARLKRMLSTNS